MYITQVSAIDYKINFVVCSEIELFKKDFKSFMDIDSIEEVKSLNINSKEDFDNIVDLLVTLKIRGLTETECMIVSNSEYMEKTYPHYFKSLIEMFKLGEDDKIAWLPKRLYSELSELKSYTKYIVETEREHVNENIS